MHTRVQLNPTRLAILSIPKDKYWIFTAPVLQLLYHEASKLDEDREHFDSSEEVERDSRGLYEPNNRYESESDDSSENENYSEGFFSSSERQEGVKKLYKRKMTKLSRQFDSSLSEKESSNSGIRHDLVDNSSKLLSNERSESSESLEDLSSSVSSSDESLTYHDHHENYFFHIAFSPIECTVICSTDVMKKLFKRPLDVCKALNYDDVKLLDKPYLSLFIDCDRSLDNTPAILELTRPLSENNITLFFLSSHFSNIVLIPYDSEERVINILTKKNFEFSDVSNSFIANNTEANYDDIDDFESYQEKSDETPLYNISMFVENGTIIPCINSNVKLLLTGSRSGKVIDSIMKTSKIVSDRKLPEYFCITRTSFNEVSLILPRSSRKRSLMGFHSKNIIGSVQDIIIPITIDLQKLPLDSTGIVAGLSSKLLEGVKANTNLYDTFEMSYLSMARSAIMMIPEENLEQVAHILNSFKHESCQ